MNEKWGFLRESSEDALKAGIDKATGLHRTGLNEYLEAIFPEVSDWIHDKCIKGVTLKRPDYRSETLKMIVEFDGLPHYTNPDQILKDKINTAFYESLGYKVVRIPYFIQLSNSAVKTLFGVEVEESLFNEEIPSLNAEGRCTPAYLCPIGIKRMVEEFKNFPRQLEINIKALKKENNEYLTGVSFLEN